MKLIMRIFKGLPFQKNYCNTYFSVSSFKKFQITALTLFNSMHKWMSTEPISNSTNVRSIWSKNYFFLIKWIMKNFYWERIQKVTSFIDCNYSENTAAKILHIFSHTQLTLTSLHWKQNYLLLVDHQWLLNRNNNEIHLIGRTCFYKTHILCLGP